MLSFWEQQSFLQYHYIVVGGGITGLSTAISLLEKNPKAEVLVLERGLFSSGASTKNAGFACIGSPTELLADLKQLSEAEVVALVEMRLKGLQRLRQRLGDTTIDYREEGSYDLLMEDTTALNELDRLNAMLQPIVGGKAFSPADGAISRFGFNKQVFRAAIQNHYEGQLDTGKMMKALAKLATQKGATLLTGCQVEHLEETPDGVEVYTSQGANSVTFKADKLAICTNAFAANILPQEDIKPGRGQVLVTEPIPNLPFKGIFHFEEGFYYFRNLGQQVIFGGGRNKDFEGETSQHIALNKAIQQDLEDKLSSIILPGINFRIQQRWAGIMAFGQQKMPIVKLLSDRMVAGVRLNGMGVAIGSQIGEQLSELLLRG